jgi:hypothetical protein
MAKKIDTCCRVTSGSKKHPLSMSGVSKILNVAFISLCHQQVDHFHEKDEKDGNKHRIVVHMRCLEYPQSSGPSSERMDTIRISRALWS